MGKSAVNYQSLLLGFLALQAIFASAQAPSPQSTELFPGFTATPASAALAGFAPIPGDMPLPGDTPSPMAPRPLAGPPSVLVLTHLGPGEMSDADNQLVSSLRATLSQEAARSSFDISDAAWHYEQIACLALPDDLLLAFEHGPEREGSSRFVAILPRDHAAVRIVPAYAHGLLPFQASWSRSGNFAIFNRMRRQARGETSLSKAPNWLLLGMCYAEMSGYPVQVLTAQPNPEPTLDLLRLQANVPQLLVSPDGSADVMFSDVSRPGVTTNWNVHFDRRGDITSASHDNARQPLAIALKP